MKPTRLNQICMALADLAQSHESDGFPESAATVRAMVVDLRLLADEQDGLLAACKMARHALNGRASADQADALLHAAIAKAEGGAK